MLKYLSERKITYANPIKLIKSIKCASLESFCAGFMRGRSVYRRHCNHGADLHPHASRRAYDYADFRSHAGRHHTGRKKRSCGYSIGLPVFSNFTGGAQCLVGPTGGFILSFPLMAYIIGLGAKRYYERKSLFILSLIAGTAVNYLIGVLMFAFVTGGTLAAGFAACVMPFIPTTIIKMILAAVLGLKIRKRLPLSINNR